MRLSLALRRVREEATLKVVPEARSIPSTASTEGKESGKDPKNYYNTR